MPVGYKHHDKNKGIFKKIVPIVRDEILHLANTRESCATGKILALDPDKPSE